MEVALGGLTIAASILGRKENKMKGWHLLVGIIIAYLVGSYFPVSRIKAAVDGGMA